MTKLNIFKTFLLVSILTALGFGVLLSNHKAMLESKENTLAQIEIIVSTIQRVSKIELERGQDAELMELVDELILSVDEMCEELYLVETGGIAYFARNEAILTSMDEVVESWGNLKAIFLSYRITNNRDKLYLASEDSYKEAAEATDVIRQYIDVYSAQGDTIWNIIIGNVLCVIVLLICIFFNTHKELQQNKEISKDMYLDIATGIYNRAKCQEILKAVPSGDAKNRAVIVFDLNDLKKTNDTLGHRAGDDLIYDFAQQIKKATTTFENDIFVGRYGGDEFMAFLDQIEEQDVKNYIVEVQNVLDAFNNAKLKSYQLSCAVGYGITSTDNPSITNRELFDIADADMFKNKMAMKERKKQELKERGLEVEEYVDDRI